MNKLFTFLYNFVRASITELFDFGVLFVFTIIGLTMGIFHGFPVLGTLVGIGAFIAIAYWCDHYDELKFDGVAESVLEDLKCFYQPAFATVETIKRYIIGFSICAAIGLVLGILINFDTSIITAAINGALKGIWIAVVITTINMVMLYHYGAFIKYLQQEDAGIVRKVWGNCSSDTIAWIAIILIFISVIASFAPLLLVPLVTIALSAAWLIVLTLIWLIMEKLNSICNTPDNLLQKISDWFNKTTEQ